MKALVLMDAEPLWDAAILQTDDGDNIVFESIEEAQSFIDSCSDEVAAGCRIAVIQG